MPVAKLLCWSGTPSWPTYLVLLNFPESRYLKGFIIEIRA
jgi:hypothetical protein